MRTTVNIDERLLIEVKTMAATSGRTMTDVVEDAIRTFVARRTAAATSVSPPLATLSGGGLQPGVDLDDNAALLELMEGTSA